MTLKCITLIFLISIYSNNIYSNDEYVKNGKVDVNVSGQAGENAEHGANISGEASRATKGKKGGDATQATEGQHAGSINARIYGETYNSSNFNIEVDAITPGRKNIKVQSSNIDFQGLPQVSLSAIGGNGGHGGNGGRGQKGGKGHDGADATRYSSGTNGDRGATGGDGGLASDGKTAGNAGPVNIQVPMEQLELLTLIKSYTYGGLKGRRGIHGNGGPGGNGGDGGSSYSWTETESYTTTSTDSEGNTTTETHTRLVTKNNPGGSDGPTGYTGNKPTKALFDGQHGADDRVTFEVYDKNGNITIFKERYRLHLVSYDIVSENRDQIIEPGESVEINKLEVKNVGEMSLPSNVPVIVMLKDSKYYVTQGIELKVPKALAPGQTHTFENLNIKFSVKNDIVTPKSERLFIKDRVSPKAVMSRTNVELEEFNNKKIIEITFPIEIEPIESLHSLSPGGASKYTLKITNISQKAFGSSSELKRAIEYQVQNTGGDLQKDQIHFYDQNGKELNLVDGILNEITNLKPGETTYFRGIVAIDANAESYRKSQLSNKLMFETLHDGTQEIQNKVVNIGVAETYFNKASADYLLVANERLTRPAYTAWQETFKTLNSEASLWDLSYYDFLDMTKGLSKGYQPTTLLEDFRGKTIIFLTNHFSNNEKRSEIENFLKRSDIKKALIEYDIKFYFVGDNDKRQMWQSFLNPFDIKFHSIYKSESRKNLAKEVIHNDLLENTSENYDYTETEVTLEMDTWKFGKKTPTDKKLKSESNKLSATLQKRAPDKNTIVIHTYKPTVQKKLFWGLLKKWDVGTISILSRPDSNKDMGIHAITKKGELFSPEFIQSKENQKNILLATHFENVINNYNKILNKKQHSNKDLQSLQMYEEVILQSIIDEQVRLRTYIRKHGLSKSSLNKHLSKLNKFASIAKPTLYKNSSVDSINSVLRVSSYLNYYHRATRTWISTLLFPYTTRDSLLKKYTENKVKEITASYFSYAQHGVLGKIKNTLIPQIESNYFNKKEIGRLMQDLELNLYSQLKEHLTENDLSKKEAFNKLNSEKGNNTDTIVAGTSKVSTAEDYISEKTHLRLNDSDANDLKKSQQDRKNRLSVEHPGLREKVNQIKSQATPPPVPAPTCKKMME